MSTGCYQKNKEWHGGKTRERYQNLSEEQKIESENMVMNHIKIFLNKRKIKEVSMNVNAIKASLKMKNKG